MLTQTIMLNSVWLGQQSQCYQSSNYYSNDVAKSYNYNLRKWKGSVQSYKKKILS
jgi:hypothetical protein